MTTDIDETGINEAPETEEERMEAARDLRRAAQQALGADEERKEWVMDDVSPRRRLYVLYNMVDGERIAVPKFLFDVALVRMIPGTRNYMFTAQKSKAPPHVVGSTKCFLHPDSVERPVLNELGITLTCNASELRNAYSKRIHAQNRHAKAWEAYQEHLSEQAATESAERSQAQLEATLALAKAALTKEK